MLALFGLFMAIAYDAPWYIWLIGFMCLCIESSTK